MDSLRDHFLLLWSYEAHANQAWRDAAAKMPDPDRSKAILRHILGCYSGWAVAVTDAWTHPDQLDPEDSKLWDDLYQVWRTIAETDDLSRVIELRAGRRASVAELMHHVLNHGTYHRGHLRGLAEAAQFTDFPDTDSAHWFVDQRR